MYLRKEKRIIIEKSSKYLAFFIRPAHTLSLHVYIFVNGDWLYDLLREKVVGWS